MERPDFVVVGLESVHRAAQRAELRGWSCGPVPAPIRTALSGAGGARLLRHPEARLDVVLTPAPLPCRAAGWWSGADSVALDHLAARFSAVLGTCAEADDLLRELVAPPRRPTAALAV